VYFTVGGLIAVVALFLVYGIKDVIYKDAKTDEDHASSASAQEAGTVLQRDSTFRDSQLNPPQAENAEVKALKASEVLRCVGRELSTDP
jgi:hypothetical protein